MLQLSSAVLVLVTALLAVPLLTLAFAALIALVSPTSPASPTSAMSTHAPDKSTAPSSADPTGLKSAFHKGGEAQPEANKEEKQWRGEPSAAAIGRAAGGEESGGGAATEYEPQFTGVIPGTDEGKTPPPSPQEDVENLPPMDVNVVFETGDELYATLCQRKSDTFAIFGKAEQMPIWVCYKKDKVADVLKGMIQRHILSVPVLLDNGKWYGFLDMMDIVRYVVRHFGATAFKEGKDFWELVREENKFEQETVENLMQMPSIRPAPFVPVIQGYSAFGAVEIMERETGVRRVPVLNNRKDRQLINLITQSQCLKWFAKHVDLLGGKKKEPVGIIQHFLKPVISVKEDDVAIAAFELMVNKNVQGVAVVDTEGRLVGNLSIRDLKIVGPDVSMFWRLQQSVKNFLIKVRHDNAARDGRRHRHAIYVLPRATLKDVIVTLDKHDVHRVYIVNNHKDRKPIGVISIRDVLLECIGV